MKSLEEANNRLSSQLLKHGKQLVTEQPKSLLEELEDAPRNEVSCEILLYSGSKEYIGARYVHVERLSTVQRLINVLTIPGAYCIYERH